MLEFAQKYFEFIENLKEGIWIIDADANTTFVNTPMAEMLGYIPSEMIGKHIFCFLDDAVVESAKNNLQRRTQGIRECLEFEFKHKNGSKVITSVNTYPLMSKDGIYNGAIAAIADLTERKNLEETSHQLEVKFKAIFDSASIGLAILNKDLQIIDANIKLCEKLGYTREEIFNISLLEIVEPEDKNNLLENIDNLIEGTLSAFMAEYKFIRKKVSIGWGVTNFFAVKEGQNKEIKIIVSLRDITEKKNLEFELAKSEALFRSVFESSTAIITIWNRELRNLYANPAAFKLIGRKIEDGSPNKSIQEGLPNLPGFAEKWEKRVLDCFSSGVSWSYTDVDQIGSQLVWSESFTNPINDSNGNVFAVAIIFRDVSKRKQLEQELLKAEKFAALGHMAAQLSHEIRSPLASISMNLDLLSKNLKLDERQEKSFALINKEIERLNNLLQEILGFSSEFHLYKVDFDIKETLDYISELLKPNFKGKNVKFINMVGTQQIHGDADKIAAAIIDVIKNSLDAISSKGTIEIYSQCRAADNIFELFIKDSGCGVEDSAKLFDPFYTTKTRGTGLGLPIAKIIIEKHGGTINLVSSRPGKTIFQINLPINEKTNQ